MDDVTVRDEVWLAQRFENHRPHLRSVAYRILGSVGEAEDAIQEAWIRLSRSNSDSIENLAGWLTTVVGRVSLNMLQSRQRRREDSLEKVTERVPDDSSRTDPEGEALLADSVGTALLVVLESLGPEERLAFVLHDMFGVPFDEIARIVDRSPQAARQLASRARRKVQARESASDPDLKIERRVVEAFLAAARAGDFRRLVAVLAPDAVLRADVGRGAVQEVRGADAIAGQAIAFSRDGITTELGRGRGDSVRVVTKRDGEPLSVASFMVCEGRIVAIDIVSDPEWVSLLDPGSSPEIRSQPES